MKRLICLLVCLGGLASADPLPNATDRVAGLARVWARIKFFHPYLAYKDIDWDGALIAAIPKVEAAQSTADYRAAIAGMVGALHDPVTHVDGARSPQSPLPSLAGDWLTWPSPGVLEIALAGWQSADYTAALANAKRVTTEAAKAKAIVVDTRGAPNAVYLADLFAKALPAYDEWPTQRTIEHDGFRSQIGPTSGDYYSTFVIATTHPAWAGATPGPSRAVFIVDPQRDLPPVVLALQASGHGAIVATAALSEDSIVQTTDVDAGAGIMVHVRLGELTGGAPTAEIVRDPAKLEARAIAIARGPALSAKRAARRALPPMRVRDDAGYEDSPYPSRELRVLAGIRLWAIMDAFNPYKSLVTDWDRAFVDAVPALEAAPDADSYVRALRVLGTKLHDGHVRVGPIDAKHATRYGEPAVELRIVEGVLAIATINDPADAKSHQLAIGDVVETIDGKPARSVLADVRETTTGSTAEARDQRAASTVLRGIDGSSVALGVRGKATVTLVRSHANVVEQPSSAPHWKRLANDIGYVDLRLLAVSEIDAMLADLATTHAIVFDMRGYPNGVFPVLAPRLNVKHAAYAAEFHRPRVVGDDRDSATRFLQPIAAAPAGASIYRGKVVVLIDDRALSQAEHTCLFLREAAGARFVGSPTHGANGDVTGFKLPGALQMSFTGQAVRFVDGTQLQQRGVQPDVLVRPTLAGLRAGKDEVLDRALALIATGR